jgi:hypothetical protein
MTHTPTHMQMEQVIQDYPLRSFASFAVQFFNSKIPNAEPATRPGRAATPAAPAKR